MKPELRKKLSKVEGFQQPEISLEQYMTPPALAADMVHAGYMRDDIEGKEVVDLGAGTGILAIGAALAGAEVTAVEVDGEALETARRNAEALDVIESIEFRESDITEFRGSFDTCVMNPPFAVHSDSGMKFLEKAYQVADATYFLAPKSSEERIKDFTGKTSHTVEDVEGYTVSLPPTYGFHTSESREVEVLLFATRKQDGA